MERIDDVIIINSHKIYPAEIKNAILTNSSIYKCIIIKCEYMESEFICCLYMGTSLDEKDLKDKVSKILLPYEIPRVFFRCLTIPEKLIEEFQ